MRALQLNLATRPFRNNTLVWLAYIGLLGLAAWFTYWNVSSFRHYKEELAQLDQEQGNRKQEQGDLVGRHRGILKGVGRFDRASIVRRTSKANQVIEWKAFSWTRLFNQLGELLPYNIRVTSVRPVFRDRQRSGDDGDSRRSIPITIEGLARDWDAFFDLEKAVIGDQSFGGVEPRQVSKMPNGELSFLIYFAYYPDEPATDDVGAEEVAVVSNADEAAPIADEVTDEWAAHGQPVDSSDGAAEPTARANENVRRSLPAAQPEPPTDDEGQSR